MEAHKILTLSAKQLKDIQYYMPKDEVVAQLAGFFSVFSDSTRVRILSLLSLGKMCVNDIAVVLKLNQTTVSHQLKTLKHCGIVTFEREGKIIYYSLVSEEICDVISGGVNYLMG